MKKSVFIISLLILNCNILLANGVVFNKTVPGTYLTLEETSVFVTIEGQVANTVATQIFRNAKADSLTVSYAFPLPENASATKLRYKINGSWYSANFSPVPQDTTTVIDPGEEDYLLKQYLGINPLFFNIEQEILLDSTIIVELTYVDLLEYKFGDVTYHYPNNYQSIQTKNVLKQEINLVLNSERTIESIKLLSHEATSLTNSGNQAFLSYIDYEKAANANYNIIYRLSANELGLFSLSTFIPDSLQIDSFGRGFFSFIVEPDPSENTEVIQKVFSLIIDVSGSMGGDKIVQARDAARFIVENLNEGDKFNIISFASNITSFRPEHVEFNFANKDAAIDYINSLNANGMTDISGAFNVAVPQFSYADMFTANIIIFITDGDQTQGILDTDDLISHINNLIVQSEKQISLFTFGIGSTVNERLLTAIANSNNGTSEFLMDNELEEVITNFYLMVQNPVLLNTKIEFSPSIISEIYPAVLPNLYKGKQMVLVGRYNEPIDVLANLSGNAYSNDVDYEYTVNLSDTFNIEYQFLTKLWAKGKIEYLMDQYYLNLNNIEASESIKETIIGISMDYGVISPFTSFQGGDPDDITTNYEWDTYNYELIKIGELINEYMIVESVSPNPCKDYLSIKIKTKDNVHGILSIGLVDSGGKLIHSSDEFVNSRTTYEFYIDIKRLNLKSGVYFLFIQYNNRTLSCKVVVQ